MIDKYNRKNMFFLDVDGVLNTSSTCVCAPSGVCIGIDEARIAILANAMKQVGMEGVLDYLKEHPEIEEFVIIDDNHFGFGKHSKLFESFVDIKGNGIEHSVAASKTPSVPAILFLSAIQGLKGENRTEINASKTKRNIT